MTEEEKVRNHEAGDLRLLGIDVGGTFTDVVFAEGNQIQYAKASTTPRDMHVGVRHAIEKVLADLDGVDYAFHGTTAVINALLERKGAVVGLITTEGFRDVYEIGRGSRSEPFNMFFTRPQTFVPRRLRREVVERVAGDGAVVTPLDEESVLEAGVSLQGQGVESIAVCLLNSYINPEHERQVLEILRENLPHIFVSTSHQLAREWREYERTSTVVMDAFVKPRIHRYINDLEQFLSSVAFHGELQIFQSNGGSTSPRMALDQPLGLVESGPSAGIVGVAALARVLDLEKVVSFDMGGTTAKTSLVEGFKPTTTRPYYVGGRDGFPSLLPVVDILEIGAGGGSIAFIDQGGGLKVGPASAGADPGPVAYGRGGLEPTITDAHVVLGRINPQNFLGGEMPLDIDAPRKAISASLAEPLGMSVEKASQGIIDIANNHMAMMLRRVSLERGHDPREMTLIAIGGAGPLHATDIARVLAIPRVVVPVRPAHFSAFGMLMSDMRLESVRTFARLLDSSALYEITQGVRELEAEIVQTVTREGGEPGRYVLAFTLELCYEGQEHPLEIPFQKRHLATDLIEFLEREFHERHSDFYGFSVPGEPIRILSIRVEAVMMLPKPEITSRSGRTEDRELASPVKRRTTIEGQSLEVPVYDREGIDTGATVRGPAIIEEPASTTLIGARDSAEIDHFGNVIIEVGADAI